MNEFQGPYDIKKDTELAQWDCYYKNDVYEVYVRDAIIVKTIPAFWLAIKRLDREPVRSWTELQEIKNQIVGETNTGFEVYPPEDSKFDYTNTYHIFVFKNDSIKIPIKLTNDEKSWNKEMTI